MDRPFCSIITVTRNALSGLVETINSVAGQTFLPREHIVVDGASTDGSLELLQSRADCRLRWISEPDDGISDAFNKAVALSTGRVLLFLGAGDCFFRSTTLEEAVAMMGKIQPPYFCYGDVEYIYERHTKLIRKNYSFRRFCRYNCLPHQAMFLDRYFFDTFGLFDLGYQRAMDYEHIARFIREHSPGYLSITIAKMPRTGVSTNLLASHDEIDQVRRKHQLDSEVGIFFSRVLLKFKIIIQKIIYGHPW